MKDLLIFPFFYLKEILMGSLLIARDVLSPKQKIAPILLHLPLGTLTSRQRLLLACLISMTPGTISVGEEKSGCSMIIHSLYGADHPDHLLDHLQDRYVHFVSKLPI